MIAIHSYNQLNHIINPFKLVRNMPKACCIKEPDAYITFESIRALVLDDMNAVDQMIKDRLASEVVLVNQLGQYIISSGGKRLRPLLTLLCAGAVGYQKKNHIDLAAIIEFIHTATLLHDDVVDASELRRGRKTANSVWGNEASVLVGDFLYSRSFQMMVELKNLKVMSILAQTTNTIAEGEVMQLLNCNDANTTEKSYLKVIYSKTAKLFEAAAQLSAVVNHSSPEEENAMATYGRYLGTSFQLIDDVLDYSASAEEMGKNVGDDLAEGKPTLPLIYAMRKGTPEQVEIIRQSIEQGGLENIDSVMNAILSTKALKYTTDLAWKESQKAIDALSIIPESPYKQALISLAEFSVTRNS